MLSAVLSKKTCAGCKFCCSFRRQSLWETPLVSEQFIKRHASRSDGTKIAYRITTDKNGTYASPDLTGCYKTSDSEEEAPCPFLDASRGCTLPAEEKPFDCKIWPLRLMQKKDGTLCVCLTPTCPAINALPLERMKALVCDGVGAQIAEHAKTHPYIIKEYKEGFIVLMDVR